MDISKAQQKKFNQLRLKKFRLKLEQFIVEGDKICTELLESKQNIESIYATEDWMMKNQSLLSHQTCHLFTVDKKELKKISNLKSTPSAISLVNFKPDYNTKIDDKVLFLLEDIQDPGNLGTIIRTIDWFGCKNLILSPNCVDVYNPKTIQASMGSIFNVNFIQQPLEEFISTQNEREFYCADMNGSALSDFNSENPIGIIIGNEGNGVSNSIKKIVKNSIHIKGKGSAESLNAAIATSIFCWKLS